MRVVALLALGGALGAQALTREGMRLDLEYLREQVARRWAYVDDKREHSGVDLDALIADATRRAATLSTQAEFEGLLAGLAADLQDGHASVRVPGARVEPERWPVALRETTDGFVVTASEDRRWQPGMVVATLGDSRIDELLAERARTICASTAGARRVLALETLSSLPDTVAGETLGWRRLRDDVGLLRIPSFKAADWQAWTKAKVEEREGLLAATKATLDRALAELGDARWLVIDVRGNRGGTDLLGIHLAEKLVPKSFRYFELQERNEQGAWSKRGGLTYGKAADRPVFAGRVIVLIDEFVFSAADDFVACVADGVPGIQLVGRPTHGGTGAPRMIATLPYSKAIVTVTTQKVFRPNGALIEGRGTLPTVPVRWTRAHVVEKRDADLEAALALCR